MSAEFDVIQRYFQRRYERGDIVVENGDDCAVVVPPTGKSLAVSSDTLLEGVHFLPDSPAELLGHKALAVNLSDLAAMGAAPGWFTLALTLPEVDDAWLKAFSTGLFRLADSMGVALLGGDTTRGPLSITITAMGFLSPTGGVLRSGAQAGDDVYVTGSLGAAALGLKSLRGDADLPAAHEYLCLQRLEQPQPRVMAGLALAPYATAMIDCSDGFAADLGHILEASGVDAVIRAESLPMVEAVREVVDATGDWSLPLAGGDDYELIFTAPAAQRDTVASLVDVLDCPVTWVGSLFAGKGEMRIEPPEGVAIDLAKPGYSHF
ncbi:MAG: thiamine-phosphate kinase [bacterium]